MSPFDTEAGQQYLDSVLNVLGAVDLVIFDNLQALTLGDLREPESWRKVYPWTLDLTGRCIGQVWVQHTGLDETHAYGDKTREWGLDTVGIMERAERPEADIAFTLKFPKARERTPDNRADFEPVVITLADDQWTSSRDMSRPGKRVARDRVLELITDAIASYGEIPPSCRQIPPDTPCIKEDLARRVCEAGCISEGTPEATRKAIYRALKKLLATGFIGKHEPWIWIVR
jgi:hypothetical protein